jgi:opacity protein-like surface antigen
MKINTMKINTTIRTIIKIGTLSLSFTSLPAFAAFGVNSEYQSADTYGNGQISCFRGAMTGDNHLTAEEEALLLENLPLREVGHYYGRVSGNSGTLALGSIQNRSMGVNSGAFVATNRARLNQVGLEIALGYVYDKSSRLELEYLVNRNLTYTANPVLGLPAVRRSITSQITNNTFLVNGYYEFVFGGYDRFKPFVVFGLGPSFSSVKTSVTPGFVNDSSQRTKQYVSFAFGGGIGFRFSIFTRWYVTASFRYISLGKVKLEPNSSFRLQGSYTYAPVSLGLIYIF